MSDFELLRTIPAGNTLGECILWDERSACLWWTDIHESVLYRYRYADAALERFACPERLCAFGFVDGDDRLVCAFASGFALFDPASGARNWLWRPEQDLTGTRFNDGRVDRQGRFWSGTMVEGEARDSAGNPASGSLYWLAGDRHGRALGGIGISNGIAFSPDGSLLYFADSPTRRIMAYDLNPDGDGIGSGRVFAPIAGDGAPDGSTVDADGFVWNAQWSGGRVVRYSPDGRVDRVLALPVSQPTCVCFGGKDLDLLCVSSARENLAPDRLLAEPEAGNVFLYRTRFRGLPESRYRLR